MSIQHLDGKANGEHLVLKSLVSQRGALMFEHSTQHKHLARFCPQCSCGCPALFIDHNAPAERQLVMTDDFGQSIHMSIEQLQELITQAQNGSLTRALQTITHP